MDDLIEQQILRLQTKLQKLTKIGYRPRWQGSDLRIRTPVTEHEVTKLESLHRITLPSDYRAFMTRVSDGLAAVLPLRESFRKEEEGRLKTPFPFTEPYNPLQDPKVRAFHKGQEEAVRKGEISQDEADVEDSLREHRETTGTLIITENPDNLLVVLGPSKGQIWWNGTGEDQGYVPLGIGFLDLVESYIDDERFFLNRPADPRPWWKRMLRPRPVRIRRHSKLEDESEPE